jgi:hypothetical protein
MIDLTKLPADEAEAIAYAEGFTGVGELFARISDLEHTLHMMEEQPRTWAGLTNEDLANCSTDEAQWALYWEKLLKEKNT